MDEFICRPTHWHIPKNLKSPNRCKQFNEQRQGTAVEGVGSTCVWVTILPFSFFSLLPIIFSITSNYSLTLKGQSGGVALGSPDNLYHFKVSTAHNSRNACVRACQLFSQQGRDPSVDLTNY